MPQMLLPIFPPELTLINQKVGFLKRDGKVYYFNGTMPIFSHAQDDLASFRLITSQLVVLGNATQSQIVRAFGISKISMKRYVKRYRERGAKGFYAPRRTRSAHVLTQEILSKVQSHLDEGMEVTAIAKESDLKSDTLNKAIRDGRLRKAEKKTR